MGINKRSVIYNTGALWNLLVMHAIKYCFCALHVVHILCARNQRSNLIFMKEKK